MRIDIWPVARFIIGPVLAAACGCGGGGPGVESSMTEAQVRGKVTVKGKPAAKGTVSFNPSNINRKTGSRTAPIKNGTYEITTLIGRNEVSVNGTGERAAGAYNSTTFEVEPGTKNTLDLDLPLTK